MNQQNWFMQIKAVPMPDWGEISAEGWVPRRQDNHFKSLNIAFKHTHKEVTKGEVYRRFVNFI